MTEKCFECGKVIRTKAEIDRQNCDRCFGDFCKVMKAHDEAIAKEFEKLQKEDNKVIDSIKKVVSKAWFKKFEEFLKEQIEDCAGLSGFEVVEGEKYKGERYKSYLGLVYYVDQWSVGYSGDSFEGYVYVQLPNKSYNNKETYLKGYYEC